LVAVPVAVLVAVTVTPGTAAPEESVTRPEILPVVCWPRTAKLEASRKRRVTTAR
jgi:hypothetical protein